MTVLLSFTKAADLLTSPQVVEDVFQIFVYDEHPLVCRLEGVFGELSDVWLQEGVKDVRKGFSPLLLQILLSRQTLLWFPLDHLSHLREHLEHHSSDGSPPTCFRDINKLIKHMTNLEKLVAL